MPRHTHPSGSKQQRKRAIPKIARRSLAPLDIAVSFNAEQKTWIYSCAGAWGCSPAAAVRRMVGDKIKHLTEAGFFPAKT